MEIFSQTEVRFWHLFMALPVFALFGAICHLARALFNYLPDRISDNKIMDMIVSDGYSFWDRAVGTEYNVAGYYALDSWRNFRNYVLWTTVSSALAWCLFPDFAKLTTGLINLGITQFIDLLFLRIEQLGF